MAIRLAWANGCRERRVVRLPLRPECRTEYMMHTYGQVNPVSRPSTLPPQGSLVEHHCGGVHSHGFELPHLVCPPSGQAPHKCLWHGEVLSQRGQMALVCLADCQKCHPFRIQMDAIRGEGLVVAVQASHVKARAEPKLQCSQLPLHLAWCGSTGHGSEATLNTLTG